ncbi:MAG: osmoprotectant transport system permease protein [Alphaproteobacteria bacterium]|jgi:osmoprotectant transport system permease protein
MRTARCIHIITSVLFVMCTQAASSQNLGNSDARSLTIGSKSFTESVILGEILTGLVRKSGHGATHRRQLGGTRILWSALLRGDIDAYPEYTGTISQEILAQKNLSGNEAIGKALSRHGIAMTAPIGFNNTYAIAMKPALAERLGIISISDLARHQSLRLGFSNEFIDRGDGWPALSKHYALPHRDVRGLDHDLAYRGMANGDIDAIDVYSTDAEISYYRLRLLNDDKAHFPAYDAVILFRKDLARTAPGAVTAFRRLEGAIDAARMSGLNGAVKLNRRTESAVASNFLKDRFNISASSQESGFIARLLRRTLEHLAMVGISLAAAILTAIPLGIFAARHAGLGQFLLGMTGIAQTIPSLALLVFMIPFFGIGAAPAIAALFLYSLLPIVRNTHAGLTGIPASLLDSALALGLPPSGRLRLVELPLALPSILAGIKISAVINIGTATLGALIGAGGYGQPILTGIRLDNMALILEGAIPAALFALLAQGLFELIERKLVPRSLRANPV